MPEGKKGKKGKKGKSIKCWFGIKMIEEII
jgi:hypothetical protein